MLLPLELVVLLLAARVWVCVAWGGTLCSYSMLYTGIFVQLQVFHSHRVKLRDELKVLKVIMNSEEMLPCPPMYLHGCTLASSIFFPKFPASISKRNVSVGNIFFGLSNHQDRKLVKRCVFLLFSMVNLKGISFRLLLLDVMNICRLMALPS